jgi:hypothetical protein
VWPCAISIGHDESLGQLLVELDEYFLDGVHRGLAAYAELVQLASAEGAERVGYSREPHRARAADAMEQKRDDRGPVGHGLVCPRLGGESVGDRGELVGAGDALRAT